MALKYEQQIINAKTVQSAWKKLRILLKKKGLTLTKPFGKAVKIKPYTYKIYFKSQPKVKKISDNLSWVSKAEKDQRRFMRRYEREWRDIP